VLRTKSRRAEFDWLRVVSLGLMFLFHSAIGFGSCSFDEPVADLRTIGLL